MLLTTCSTTTTMLCLVAQPQASVVTVHVHIIYVCVYPSWCTCMCITVCIMHDKERVSFRGRERFPPFESLLYAKGNAVLSKTSNGPVDATYFLDYIGWNNQLCFTPYNLQVLQKLPVTVGSLKQGTMGKLIKQLSKQENQGVCVHECMCVCCVSVFVGSCLATKVFIGNLQATGRGWVIIG